MSGGSRPVFEGDVSSSEAYEALSKQAQSILVDVRTTAELTFVGAPDLSPVGKALRHIEWRTFPEGGANPRFLDQLALVIDETSCDSVFFLCRSGGRSRQAAEAAQASLAVSGPVRLFNVADGFEGDLDGEGRRGRISGWKVSGLPWRQS